MSRNSRNSDDHTPETRRKNASFRRRIWVSLKRVAVKSIGFYAGKRRLLSGMVKRVVWVAVILKAKASRVARAKHGRHVPFQYDSRSYYQNFDDGEWQFEDREFYLSRSFSYRFGQTSSRS